MRQRWRFAWTWLLVGLLPGCGLIPKPPNPTPTPTPTPPPWECPLQMPRCDQTDPPQQCSSEASPCWHNPTSNPQHCEEAPRCEVPPPPELPEPQCPTFTDRGGTLRVSGEACDCYFGQAWNPCPAPTCGFPQGIPNEQFTSVENPGTLGTIVNATMAEMTGCAVGTDCPITVEPDDWMHAVCDRLCARGLNCGRHIDKTPGGTDQISVIEGSFCEGKAHQNYQVLNYGGKKKVRWAPGGTQDAWIVECSPTPPPPPPPTGDCPLPHPNLDSMKFKCGEHNGILDCTWVTVAQEPFCREIGMSPMADGTPRAGCPVRPEGNDDRAVCEAELCVQKWECNGQPAKPYKGNPAQSNCRGHWKTWCSAPGSTAVLEGDR
jgi:hypothetical protein